MPIRLRESAHRDRAFHGSGGHGRQDRGDPQEEEIVSGDCDGNKIVAEEDVNAIQKEIFDGDGEDPDDAPEGTYKGNLGCDANEDNKVDAGDITCVALIIQNGEGACTQTEE